MKYRRWIGAVLGALICILVIVSLIDKRRSASHGYPDAHRRGDEARADANYRAALPTSQSLPVQQTHALFGRSFPVLAQRDEASDLPGETIRVWLVETGPPLGRVRIERHVFTDPVTGRETIARTDAFVAADVIVSPSSSVSLQTLEATLSAAGASSWSKLYGTDRWVVHFPNPGIETKPDALAALNGGAPGLIRAEGNGIGSGGYVPNDTYFSSQYGALNTGQTGGQYGADISLTAAWDLATTSPNVVVAVLDSGIDFNHPDLQENIYTDTREIADNGVDDDKNGLVDDVHGWDFVNNDILPADDLNHGSHVAGILGARGNNGIGVAGVTWRVRILPVKILNSNNSGTTSDLISGLNYARLKGAQLVNMSLQNYPFSDSLASEIRAAGDANILLVICAGNNGTDNDLSPNYPSSYTNDNVIAVANTTSSDLLKTGSAASDFGARSVDLAAPGTSIYSTIPGGYAYFTGTSMSTPQVTGVAALLLGLHPKATVAQLRHWILDTVDVLPALAGKCVTSGRLNAAAALQASLDLPLVTSNPTSQVADFGSSVSFGVTVQTTGMVTYRWLKDGTPLSGETSDTLTLRAVQASDSGDYSVLIALGNQTVTSRAGRLTVQAPGTTRVVNLSIRAFAGSGSQTLIAGFIVSGDGKSVLLRGVGPTLSNYGVINSLSDPLLTVYSGNNPIGVNDDWAVSTNATQVSSAMKAVNAFDLPAASKDAALLQTFAGGGYTALCTGTQGASGVALLELYDTNPDAASHLVNVSGRSQVGTGDNVLIGGFVIAGASARTLLIRGVGPTLSAFGVTGPLDDPTLTVRVLNGSAVATNDNWGGTAELVANFQKLGAFDFPKNSKDAALLLTLQPGAYTAVLSGVGNSTGVGLLEIYEVK